MLIPDIWFVCGVGLSICCGFSLAVHSLGHVQRRGSVCPGRVGRSVSLINYSSGINHAKTMRRTQGKLGSYYLAGGGISRINKVNLYILCSCVYERWIMKRTPHLLLEDCCWENNEGETTEQRSLLSVSN